jgi:UDP-N-acetylmuramoylalanine--D-glutamate ligase
MRLADLAGRRVAVWGAGREGRAAWRALRARLPGQRLAVLCRPDEVDEARGFVDAATDVVAGDPDAAALARYDVVVKSPGISPYKPPVPEAQAAGVAFVSGTALWFAERPLARTIAVTGTKGKSTTTALIAHLLRAAGLRVALCGNIGVPLLELLDPPAEPDWWVMELSSFQTRDMAAAPEIAVVLNVFPEHLDWHGDAARYRADKLAILGSASRAPRVAVVNAELRGDVPLAAATDAVWLGDASGWHVDERGVRRGQQLLAPTSALPLAGRHNAYNACAALAAVQAAGVDPVQVATALATFRALPHRLQPLGERDGLEYVNDSIATTPYATLAALALYAERSVTVLVGGHDRGVSWAAFRAAMQARAVHAVIAIGAHGARIADALAGLPADAPQVHRVATLDEAVARARAVTPRGGVVLLSPGAPSFGAFRDYVERGRRFAELAGFDPNAISTIEGMGL